MHVCGVRIWSTAPAKSAGHNHVCMRHSIIRDLRWRCKSPKDITREIHVCGVVQFNDGQQAVSGDLGRCCLSRLSGLIGYRSTKVICRAGYYSCEVHSSVVLICECGPCGLVNAHGMCTGRFKNLVV